MQKLLRRVRGAIGMGFAWAVAWSAVSMVPRWVFGFNADAPFPLIFGVLGFIAGVTFSGVLVLAEGKRSIERMSLPRFAGWGAVGGILLSALWTRLVSLSVADALIITPIFAVASAACASGSLAMARRALRLENPSNPHLRSGK